MEFGPFKFNNNSITVRVHSFFPDDNAWYFFTVGPSLNNIAMPYFQPFNTYYMHLKRQKI